MATISDQRNLENPNFGSMPKKFDKSTLAQVGIGYPHHTAHEGTHFFWHAERNLASLGDAAYFYLQTANSANLAHAVFGFSVNGYTQIRLGNWTSIQVGEIVVSDLSFNFLDNRFGSANVSDTLHNNLGPYAPVGGFVPLPGYELVLGRDSAPPLSGTGSFGLVGGLRKEFILASNSKYVIQFLAGMDDVDVNIDVNLYEHADKY